MRITPLILSTTLLTLMGCSSDSGQSLAITDSTQGTEESLQSTTNTTLETTDTTQGTTGTTQGTSGTAQDTTETIQVINGSTTQLMAFFNGATFVIADQPEIDAPNGATHTDNWSVSFGSDTVTWNQSGVVTQGTYSKIDGTNSVAIFPDQEVDFAKDGSNISWDSITYSRTATSKFNSQESLLTYFDGSTYDSKELFLGGENQLGEPVMGYWSIRFNGDEFNWGYTDVIEVGTYSYIDGSSFKVSFSNRDITVYVLDNNELVLDSAIYAQALTDQFDSQETLVALLDGASYQSVSLHNVGETSSGTTALGYWYVDFTGSTFSWSYEDVAEAGNYSYVDNLNFTAVFVNREFNVSIDGNDIIWNNVRYRRVSSQ